METDGGKLLRQKKNKKKWRVECQHGQRFMETNTIKKNAYDDPNQIRSERDRKQQIPQAS